MTLNYYGEFIKLEPCHYGCNYCGTEYYCIKEPRWCLECQYDLWWDGMDEYHRLKELLHEPAI